MSLINDALKRARHQALEQEAEGASVSYRAVPAHSRTQRGPWVPILIGASVVAVLAGGFWWFRGRQAPAFDGPSASTTKPAPVETAPDGDAIRAPVPSEESLKVASEGLDEPSPRPIGPEKPSAAVEDASRAEGSVSEAAPQLTGDVDAEPAREASPQEAGARLEDGGKYLRRVTAADGSEVVLGGIVYSETRPIAVINGSMVSPGDMVAGFTVVAITPEHVELEADGVRILLANH